MIRKDLPTLMTGFDPEPPQAADSPAARRRRRAEMLKVLKDSIEELKRNPEPPDDPIRSR